MPSMPVGELLTPGPLYIVSTPIGNLEDVTLRALRILEEVDVIAAEDTRVTRKLLAAHGIRTPMVAYHAYSMPAVERALVARLEGGESVALVSDAGTPLVSDPGAGLVAHAVSRGIRIVPIPGPSAFLGALVGAGLAARHVLFLGFLPRRAGEQRALLGPLAGAPYTLVIFEAAPRLAHTLRTLAAVLGDRPAAVARELTKRYETFVRGTLATLAQHFAEPPKGELVVVVGPGPPERSGSRDEARAMAERLVARGEPASEVARSVAGACGLAKKEAYRLVLEVHAGVRRERDGPDPEDGPEREREREPEDGPEREREPEDGPEPNGERGGASA